MRILVVDDHAETRQLLVRSLGSDGHTVAAFARRADAETAALDERFDVLVVDVMLGDGSGLELCRTLREQGVVTPVLLLTARGDIRDRVNGLDAGADDYLPKPFAVAELLARVRALGRRGPALRDARFQVGDVTVDLQARRVLLGKRAVPLTARELAIVEVLAARRGGVTPREDLLEAVWGEASESASASLEVLVARIRRKLGGARAPIQTLRGVGYALATSGE